MAIGQEEQTTPSLVIPDGEQPTVDESPATMPGHNVYANGTNGTNGTHLPTGKYSIPMKESLAYTPDRKLRVVTIGAGFSGLLMAHKFQHRFPEMQNMIDHTIFEARSDVGGTWLVNTYPGVQCDVPSHIYAFPFDPNPDWTRFYSSGPEIQQYIKRTTKKWNLDRDVQLNTKVIAVEWQEQQGQWKIKVECDGESRDEYADVLISGQGVLVHSKWPEIPGLETFKGHKVHSANWDHSYDYANKRIAVIGNGSSGIQIVPQMAALPGTEVTNFTRSPVYVYYRVPPSQHLGEKAGANKNPSYSDETKQQFREDAEFYREFRRAMIRRTNKAFRMFIKGSEASKEAIGFAAAQMAEKLNHDPDLCRILIPKWELGCKRITPGEGYLESFSKPNCHITQSPITHVTENAIHTADGKTHEIDVLVAATGFDVSHCPRYPFIGRDGIDLRDKWAEEPESYMSLATSDMPNYFIMMGPNAVVGHGSLMEGLNWTGDYIVAWLKKMATEDIKSIVPKREVVEQFVRYGDEVHKTLVWTGGCKSWYKRNRVDGRVTALFAGSGLMFKELISHIRGEDFDIEYRSPNCFRFMGNGFTQFEMDPESDLAWYIE